MNDKQFYIGEGDNKTLLAFNLNVMALLQAEYGSVSTWVALLEDEPDEDGKTKRNGEPDMGAFLKGFAFMLNEGVDIENETADKKKAPYSERQVGRLIGKWGQNAVADAMKNAVSSSTDTGDTEKKE